jgi:heat shock protein HspQ
LLAFAAPCPTSKRWQSALFPATTAALSKRPRSATPASASATWYQAIPEEIRPRKDQPFYHLLAENGETSYTAYVSQQNLVTDESEEPVDHPSIPGLFEPFAQGRYRLRREMRH